MRLIDADALGIGRCNRDVLPADYCAGWNGVINIIDNAPTVDAVEVVRCEKCEFSRELTKTEKRIWLDECRACESPDASQNGYMIVFPQNFCSYGRRRDT